MSGSSASSRNDKGFSLVNGLGRIPPVRITGRWLSVLVLDTADGVVMRAPKLDQRNATAPITQVPTRLMPIIFRGSASAGGCFPSESSGSFTNCGWREGADVGVQRPREMTGAGILVSIVDPRNVAAVHRTHRRRAATTQRAHTGLHNDGDSPLATGTARGAG